MFLLSEAGAVWGIIYTDSKRSDAMRDQERASRAYHSADQVDEIADAHEAMLDAFDDVERWHESRKRWIYTAGAIWLVNVLDATLLIPNEGGGSFVGLPGSDGSGLFAAIDPERTMLGYSVSF